MAKDSDNAASTSPLDVVDEPTVEQVKAADKERKDAQATSDPNDDLAAASIDVDREVNVSTAYTLDAEAPEEPKVEVKINPNFKVVELEEYTDDQGRPRGRVKGYNAPTEIRVYSAVAHEQGVSDESGYVTLPATVPASVASDLAASPAVEVAK